MCRAATCNTSRTTVVEDMMPMNYLALLTASRMGGPPKTKDRSPLQSSQTFKQWASLEIFKLMPRDEKPWTRICSLAWATLAFLKEKETFIVYRGIRK